LCYGKAAGIIITPFCGFPGPRHLMNHLNVGTCRSAVKNIFITNFFQGRPQEGVIISLVEQKVGFYFPLF